MSVRIVPGQCRRDGEADDVRSLFSGSGAAAGADHQTEPQSGSQPDPRSGPQSDPQTGPPAPPPVPGLARPPRRRLAHPRLMLPVALSAASWTRAVAWILVTVVGCGVVGGLAWRLSIPAPTAVPPAGSGPAPASPAASPASAASEAPAADTAAGAAAGPAAGRAESAQSAAAPPVSAVSWQGTALPISPVAGPATFTANRSTGFSRSRLGAALAAVHISTHIDPYTGPAVFTPAITKQVVGGRQWLLRRSDEVYASAAEQMGVADGKPILVPTGSVQSWRMGGYTQGRTADVELLVATPDGRQVVYHVPLRWLRGDWRLVVPKKAGSDLFTVGEPGPTGRFTPFIDYPGGGR